MELADRIGPAVAVDEVVPVRDEVPERAAVVAERHAAVHAARALVLQLLRRALLQELLVVLDALLRVAVGEVRAVDLEEAAELAHHSPSPSRVCGAPTTSTASPRNSSAVGASPTVAASSAASSAMTRL